nr:uncharacterized protein LOC107384653 [Nothobranchius furzeri]
MLKSGALVLFLAVTSSQFHLYQGVMVIGTGVVDHSACPVTYFGIQHTELQMIFDYPVVRICGALIPECMYLYDPQADRATVEVQQKTTGPGSVIHQTLKNFHSTSHCILKFELKDATSRTHLTYIIYNFGKQTALQFIPTSLFTETMLNIHVVVPNNAVITGSYRLADWKNGVILDGSGCRFSGKIILPGKSKKFPKTCENAVCSPTADLTLNSLCGPKEICHYNAGCRAL